jgi:hypothetical protein
MSTASEASKAMRGTKRVCQACAVRFYDLWREPIICPSCRALYTPAAPPVLGLGMRVASPAGGKTAWRSRGFKRPNPIAPFTDPERSGSPASPAEDTTEATASVVPEDDAVLEQETDDGDLSGLVDHDLEDQKERG